MDAGTQNPWMDAFRVARNWSEFEAALHSLMIDALPAQHSLPVVASAHDPVVAALNAVESLEHRVLANTHLSDVRRAELRSWKPILELQIENLSLRIASRFTTEQAVLALSKTLGVRDQYTSGHTKRVTLYCDALARVMGASEPMRREVALAGLLHDLGKVGVSDRVLRKTSSLSQAEWQEMRAHTEWGFEIVSCLPSLYGVAEILRHHHERYDGDGYAHGLQGEEIPWGSRLVAIADTFDAMTSDRPYREALPVEQAIATILSQAGEQFDPRVVEGFREASFEFQEIWNTSTTQLRLPASIDSL